MVDILADLAAVAGSSFANQYNLRFESLCRRLADYPDSCPARPKLGTHIRFGIVLPYHVFYRHIEGDDTASILRIIQGRRKTSRKLLSGVKSGRRGAPNTSRKAKSQGPITAAYQRVLHALLWHFMSYRDGLCFPSYERPSETIAEKARCGRDTVYEAIISLEAIGVFSWVNRIDRVAERGKDLFGHWVKEYRLVRRSNV